MVTDNITRRCFFKSWGITHTKTYVLQINIVSLQLRNHPDLRHINKSAFRDRTRLLRVSTPETSTRPHSSMSWMRVGPSDSGRGKNRPCSQPSGETGEVRPRSMARGKNAENEGKMVLQQALELTKGMDSYIRTAEGLQSELERSASKNKGLRRSRARTMYGACSQNGPCMEPVARIIRAFSVMCYRSVKGNKIK